MQQVQQAARVRLEFVNGTTVALEQQRAISELFQRDLLKLVEDVQCAMQGLEVLLAEA